ncbi:FAD-dependent oxidoreductase [Tropicibacter sp. S64]|uniref:FAD-dependent oxidoreductase n=1 Tax=Tropicibacter sp. S64 TaxID=3415122 RepID=UPI003C7C93FF
MRDVDVLIAGAGPAGCAAAIPLARAGLSVRLLEHRVNPGFCIGETLPPKSVDLAQDLLGDALLPVSYPSRGVTSAWGESASHVLDYFYTPKGYGLCLDRCGFNKALRRVARDAGATVTAGARITAIDRRSDGLWGVACETEYRSEPLSAQVLIDATGRSAALARLLSLPRQADDPMFAYALAFITADADANDRFTRIEAAPFGYWYSNAVPGTPEHRVVVLHTDRDLPEAWLAREPAGFLSLLRQSTLIRPHLERHGYEATGSIRGAQAGETQLRPHGLPGLLAIGDSAQSFDPLSSQGVTEALTSGAQAAALLIEAFADDDRAAALAGARQTLAALQAQAYGQYRHSYARIYAMETRWPEAPFWARRHARGLSAPPFTQGAHWHDTGIRQGTSHRAASHRDVSSGQ